MSSKEIYLQLTEQSKEALGLFGEAEKRLIQNHLFYAILYPEMTGRVPIMVTPDKALGYLKDITSDGLATIVVTNSTYEYLIGANKLYTGYIFVLEGSISRPDAKKRIHPMIGVGREIIKESKKHQTGLAALDYLNGSMNKDKDKGVVNIKMSKKQDPRLILNFNLKDEELENKVAMAIDEYIENTAAKVIDNKIEDIINARIDKIFSENSWANRDLVRRTNSYIDTKLEEVVNDKVMVAIAKRLSAILGENIKDGD